MGLSEASWSVIFSLFAGGVLDPASTVCTPTNPPLHFAFIHLKYCGSQPQSTHPFEAPQVSRPEGGDFVESDNMRVRD